MNRVFAGVGIIALSCVMLAPVVRGGGICRSRVIYPTYAAPVVQQTYAAPAYKNVVLVPKAVQVNVSPDYYYSVAEHYRDKLLVDAIAGRLQQMQAAGQLQAPQTDQNYQELLKLLIQMQLQQKQSPFMPPIDPAPTVVDAGGADPKLAKVIQEKCVRCHHPGNKQGTIDMTNLGALDELTWWKAYGLVNSGEMPKGGQPISNEETVLFYQHARSLK